MPLATSYDGPLICLSLLVAISAAYVALGVAEGIRNSTGRVRMISIFAGGAIMGIAIWAMHYVGMLALQLPVTVRYDWPLVLLSIAVSIIASAVTFVLIAQPQLSRARLCLGALAMGSGIATMHYIGMAAMRMQCLIAWNTDIVVLSVVIAIVVSGVALASFRRTSGLTGYSKLLAASLLGIAISSMHYVGMAAAHFVKSTQIPDFSGTLSVSALGGTGIGAVSLAILALARGGTFIRQYVEKQSRRLAHSERRYQLLFEKCLLGIYRVDFNGIVIDINDAGVKLLGYDRREELIGTNLIGEHLSGADGQAFSDLVTSRLEIPLHEMELVGKDGTKTCVLNSATTVESVDGAKGEVQGFFLSIADLKWTENELRKAQLLAEAGNVAKRQFMTRMSHELRTPLNGILGMTGILMDTKVTEQQREYLALVQQSGETLLASIDEILVYANESSPKPESDWGEFVLRDLIAAQLRMVKFQAERRGVTIHCQIDNNCSDRYFSDIRRLRHVISGLLSNAVKFTKQGQIVFSAHSRSSVVGAYPIVTIAVSDTGVGIPRDQLNSIFEPFFESDPLQRTRSNSGTGLGLATVKAALSALHGNISVESEVGKGSTFTVELPMRPILPQIYAA